MNWPSSYTDQVNSLTCPTIRLDLNDQMHRSSFIRASHDHEMGSAQPPVNKGVQISSPHNIISLYPHFFLFIFYAIL